MTTTEWIKLIYMGSIDLTVYRASISCNYAGAELRARSLKNKARGREALENTQLYSTKLSSSRTSGAGRENAVGPN
jgi:hypothetical protein